MRVLPFLFFICTTLAGISCTNTIEIKNLKFFVNGKEHFIKAVAYNPAPLGMATNTGLCSVRVSPFSLQKYTSQCEDSDFYDGSSGEAFREPPGPGGFGGQWFKGIWDRDLYHIQDIGFNAIRMYNMQPATQDATLEQDIYEAPMGKSHIEFMNAAYAHNLSVIFPLYGDKSAILNESPTAMRRFLRNQIDEIGNHPALIMYTFGNELGIFDDNKLDTNLLNSYMQYIRGYQKAKWNRFIPVTIAEIDYPTSYPRLFDELDVDIFTTNGGYRGNDYTFLFSGQNEIVGLKQLACQFNKPIFIGEFGAHLNDPWVNTSTWFTSNFAALMGHIDDGCIGGAFFEWNDEPLKDTNQQNMGIVKYLPSSNSLEANGFIPDLLVKKNGEEQGAYDWRVLSGENGANPNLKTNPFTFLNRSPFTSTSPGPSICQDYGGLSDLETIAENIVIEPYSAPDPLAHYAFEDDASDSSSNGNDGSLGGTPTFVEGVKSKAIFITRYPNGIDLGDQYVNTGLLNQLNQRKLTFMAWIKIEDPSLDNFMKIASSKLTWDATSGWDLEYNPSSNKLTFIGSGSDLATGIVDLDKNWHHIAVSVNTHIARLYVDGMRVNYDDQYATPVVGNTERPILIGSSSTTSGQGGTFTGAMDEVYVWNTYIPEEGIKQYYDLDKPAGHVPVTASPTTLPPVITPTPPNKNQESSGARSLFSLFLIIFCLCFTFKP